jgi:hypothetical protein
MQWTISNLRVMAKTSLLERLTIINLRQEISTLNDFLLHGQLWVELDGVLKGDNAYRNLCEVVLCFRAWWVARELKDHAQAIVEARMPLARAAGCIHVILTEEDASKRTSGAYADCCRKFSNLTSQF